MECPACSFDNNDDSQFCSQCGFPLYIDESELPDDVHLPASSWDGMERAVPYVIAGLRTGQFPSSLNEGESSEDESNAPKKLETVFYADYAEAFGVAEGELEPDSDGEPGDESLPDGDDPVVEESLARDIDEAAPEKDETDEVAACEAVSGKDAAGEAAIGETVVGGAVPNDAAVDEDAADKGHANGDDAELSVETTQDDAVDELLQPQEGFIAEACSGDAEASSEASADDGFGDIEGESESQAASAPEDEDQTPEPETDEKVDGEGESESATSDDEKTEDDGEDDDIPMPRGKHARIPSSEEAETVKIVAKSEPGDDDTVKVAGSHDDAADSADASDADSNSDDQASPPEGAPVSADEPKRADDVKTAGDAASSDDLYDGGEPPWPEEYRTSQGPLDSLPTIGAEDFTRMQTPDETAVMPIVTRRDAIRYSTSDRDRLDARRKRAPKLPMLIAALLAVFAIGGGVYLLSQAPGGVEVPDVVGMSSDSARTELLEAGFQVDVKSQLTEDNFGIVLSCDPEAGTKRRHGTHVTITVSASRTIPDVVGLDLEAAQNKLADEGAENVQVASKASNQPENTVIDIEPSAGSAFNPEDEITLTVATSAKVPDVAGMQQEEAMAAVSEAGYVAEVKWADSDADAGTVVSTTPEGGAVANLNSTVTIFVASPGPRDIYHVFDYYDAMPADDSEYLQWKGFTIAGGYTYEDGDTTYASQTWQQTDGSTISFTSAPYTSDVGASFEDYMAEGFAFQGIRLYIPAHSAMSLGTDVSMSGVQAYMDACGFDNIKDSCTNEDVESEGGASGSELGLPALACAQGETNGYVWTVLVTDSATYIGCGPEECYEDMDPICDGVVVNEMYAS